MNRALEIYPYIYAELLFHVAEQYSVGIGGQIEDPVSYGDGYSAQN